MLQIADLFSYLLRHHAELRAGYTTPEYADEVAKVSSWVSRIATLLVPDTFVGRRPEDANAINFSAVLHRNL